jgi:porphobilinogen synthase
MNKIRPRRLRASANLREAVAQTRLDRSRLMQPHFVIEGERSTSRIDSMPGIERTRLAGVVERVGADLELGIKSVLLFGLADHKDELASAATQPDGLIPRAVRRLRDEFGERVTIVTDVCLCGSTSHGHCGVLREGKVLNDETLPLLSAMALAHARAGADVVAPSDMMDGRVGAIREALDAAGFTDVAIGSYCTKYASAFYGPFREALDSAPRSGDKKTYQMDPANAREALRELALDEAEGADWVMVKPGLVYADVIRLVREHTALPVAAYHVSGEYAMLRAAAERGWLDYDACLLEALTSLKRAGADIIFSYGALDAARLLKRAR